MEFLPDGRLLVTEKPGRLRLVSQQGEVSSPLAGLPQVDYGGQGGLGDVVLHPDFEVNRWVYISFVEAGDAGTRGAAVARGTLSDSADALEGLQVLWRQLPKVDGQGHYGHRIAFDREGYLFISNGERQMFDPAQDMSGHLGKIVRLFDDGTAPFDNPFFDQGGVAQDIWSLGHRNPLGLAFDAQGRLWNTEMGPKHGDELNLVKPGHNYGYPWVSNGDHYSGEEIPDHDTRPDLEAPMAYWVPAISPAGLMFYSGARFTQWQGQAFTGGLSSKALVRIEIGEDSARELERYDMKARIREVQEGPDGDIWVLEDQRDGSGGRLLRLSPKP